MTLFSLNALTDAVQRRRTWAEETLSEWVACPSTLGNEEAAQRYIEPVLASLGFDVRQEAVDHDAIRSLPGYSPALTTYDGRFNVVGTHTPREDTGRSLIINGHVDVVSAEPVALWSAPPFEPKKSIDASGETWIQGRGAGDMKGGSIAALWAFSALGELGYLPAAPVTFQSCIEEECTGNGTLSLSANGGKAEACLIPEPFDQTILAEQAGVLWFEIQIMGKTVHVLGTAQGVNAIDKAYEFYHLLKTELEASLNRPENLPPSYRDIVHPANLNLGVIRGGDWPSTVAGECTMTFRMGMMPGTSCEMLKQRITEIVETAAKKDPWASQYPPKLTFRGFQAEPCTVKLDSPFIRCLSSAHREVMGVSPAPLHATCTTDVRFFNLYTDTPATCYGPKAVNIHGADERVSVDSMERTALVIARFMERWCGLAKRS